MFLLPFIFFLFHPPPYPLPLAGDHVQNIHPCFLEQCTKPNIFFRATTKEESLSLPSVARGKQACSPVRRKPDVSPGRAGSPSPRQRLDMTVTPGPSGINIQVLNLTFHGFIYLDENN